MQNRLLMSQPATGRRWGLGCVMLIALPFAAIGLFAVYTGMQAYGKQPNAMVPIVFGAVFIGVSVLAIVAALYGASNASKADALRAANPDKPWMWREDWSRGIIKDTNKSGAIGIWIFTIVWNAISFPIAFAVMRQVDHDHWMPLLVLLFPLVGVFMFLGAVYQTMRSMKFGTSQCHLERVPIVPGRALRGHIELNTDAAPASGYRVRLSSLRIVTTGRGKHRNTTEHQLWDTQIVVPASAAMRSPTGTRIPFQLATPPDSHPTDETNYSDRYLWRIAAAAELPGVDYSAQFDLPVFQTGEANDGTEYAAFEQRHRAEAARHEIAPASGVRITPLPGGGEEFFIVTKKTFGSVLSSLLFVFAWNAAIVAMIRFEAPWGFAAVFIAFDIIIIIATINYFFGKTTIRVDRAGVRVNKRWFGSGRTTTYAADSIESIDGVTPAQNSQTFGVKIRLRDAPDRTLTSQLPDRESADTVAARMMRHLPQRAAAEP